MLAVWSLRHRLTVDRLSEFYVCTNAWIRIRSETDLDFPSPVQSPYSLTIHPIIFAFFCIDHPQTPHLLLKVQNLALLTSPHAQFDHLDDQGGLFGLDQQGLSALVRSDGLMKRFIEGLVFAGWGGVPA